jgi:hypothetical protein
VLRPARGPPRLPLLTIANRPVLIAGVPALVLYLFGVWAVIVAVLAWAARREDGA